MADEDDPCCSHCRVPLRAITLHSNGRCLNRDACEARRLLLKEHGSGTLIGPEGVTHYYEEDRHGQQ